MTEETPRPCHVCYETPGHNQDCPYAEKEYALRFGVNEETQEWQITIMVDGYPDFFSTEYGKLLPPDKRDWSWIDKIRARNKEKLVNRMIDEIARRKQRDKEDAAWKWKNYSYSDLKGEK